jgi:Ca-activated chloride channel homolog
VNVNLHHWFAYPLALALLAAPPVLGLLAAWATRRRRRALARLGNPAALEAVMAPRRGPRLVRGLCLTFGLFALALGVAGPQWGRDVDHSPTPGRDLIVVLDASRSMLAERPSRLERAKTALLDLAASLHQRGGHRVALVAFAGRPRLIVPLTHDYDHFRFAVEEFPNDAADPDLAPGPGDASGTRIGAALTLALQARDPRFLEACDLLLLSDGDDPAHDGEWRQGAADARLANVPVFTVGVGDAGSPRPLVLEGGQEVRTRLEEEPLREIARVTGGEYFPARTDALPLGRLYLDWIATRPEREDRDDVLPVYRPRYLWFYLAAFVLLSLTMAVPDRLPRLWRREEAVVAEPVFVE